MKILYSKKYSETKEEKLIKVARKKMNLKKILKCIYKKIGVWLFLDICKSDRL
jgi:hypothetical protein